MVSVLTGLGIFKPAHAIAVVLVFFGVRFVTKSKSRRDMEMKSMKYKKKLKIRQ